MTDSSQTSRLAAAATYILSLKSQRVFSCHCDIQRAQQIAQQTCVQVAKVKQRAPSKCYLNSTYSPSLSFLTSFRKQTFRSTETYSKKNTTEQKSRFQSVFFFPLSPFFSKQKRRYLKPIPKNNGAQRLPTKLSPL